uniref:Uncharacterized protein n=1 Tax=Marseillevirus LCMAC201 TaxID=2506605 RepID=A0A481YV89_9VIRU|nr:MAG: hypothetical protein LCMAC201_01050 [Marseillevirus LCMAC201]
MASKEDVYGAFVDYYGDLALELIKNEDGWAVYSAEMKRISFLGMNLVGRELKYDSTWSYV